jgi:benzoylformate decarboxylase
MAMIKARDALVQILRSEGVEYVWGIPGATEVHFMDALEDAADIKYILCLHEVAAVGMAEGYARASGKVGFLNLHTGTGLAAALPMLANAYYGGVPLVVTAGQQDTRLLATEPALADNLVRIAGPFTKWATEIQHAEDLPMIMRRAFKVAAHPPTCPVFVSLPQDVMAAEIDFEYLPGSPSFSKLHPDGDSIKLAVELLSEARNPVIIVEDGVAKNEALSEVVRFAEKIGARVYQPWMADVNFPVNHPQYMYDLDITSLSTRDMLEKVDVLIVVGALFFGMPVYLPEPLVTGATRVIQIDNNPWQIGKNYPVACGIEGDIKIAVTDLIDKLEERLTPGRRRAIKSRVADIAREKQAMVKAFEEKALQEKDDLPIRATRLMREIRDNIQPGTRIVDDCWSYSAILRRTVPFSEPRSYMRSRSGGSIGWGLPGAIGVKLADPERPVVCISGDGSAMWSIQSLWTASRYNIPVTFIIASNGCYRQVRLMKTLILGEKGKGRFLGTDLCGPRNDFCKIAEGMGMSGRKVDQPSRLKDVLTEALKSNRPNLIEVTVDPAI